MPGRVWRPSLAKIEINTETYCGNEENARKGMERVLYRGQGRNIVTLTGEGGDASNE